MDSPQSFGSPFKASSVLAEPDRKNDGLSVENSGGQSAKVSARREEEVATNYVGVLDVHVHQARDIHNICIYHKQDVYAKVCLTSDPENAVSTQIINGGGQNPVFNQTLRLNVRTVECSLKCEIWMMSRVRNYLEDQLLGVALVPLSEVLLGNGKLEKEFTLSSTDLFHSPSGFVQLSIAYTGSSPEVIVIPVASNKDTEAVESLTSEFEKIEFPDPKIVNENHLMVSEYIGIQCTNLDTQSSDSFASSDTDNQDVQAEENLPTGPIDSLQNPKCDSPPSSVSTNGSHPASCQSSKNKEYDVPPPQESPKEKSLDTGDSESFASGNLAEGELPFKPLVSINIKPEQNVVQQDIVDMYMKSMQQFTESLAKMKLPLDINSSRPSSSGNSSSDQTSETPKSSRVFYGSGAFF